MADSLGAQVGSLVTVTSPQGELTPFGIVPKYKRFKVVGIFSSGFYDYDNTWAFIRLADAQKLFDLGDVVSVLEFKVDDIYKADQIGRELEKAAGKGFMSTNWMEQNRALFHALRLERVVTFITIGLIVFVAALNILISLIMMVMEKTRDIAVLVSMGAKRRQMRRIFIYQGMLIGVIGTVIGLVLATAFRWSPATIGWCRCRPRCTPSTTCPSRRACSTDCWWRSSPSEFRSSRRCIRRGRRRACFRPRRCATNKLLIPFHDAERHAVGIVHHGHFTSVRQARGRDEQPGAECFCSLHRLLHVIHGHEQLDKISSLRRCRPYPALDSFRNTSADFPIAHRIVAVDGPSE